MKKISLLALVFVLISSCSDAQDQHSTNSSKQANKTQQPTTNINRVISAQEFKQQMGKSGAQLIDVRTPAEYKEGKIGSAKNIDFYATDFKEQMSKLDKSKPVLVYCAVGGRSGQAAAILKDMGFKEVYDLKGGYRGWPEK